MNEYAFKIRFKWWRLKPTTIIWASCASEAVAIASQRWIGVRYAEGFKRRDFK